MELSCRGQHEYHNFVADSRFAPRRIIIYVRPGTVWDSFVYSNLSCRSFAVMIRRKLLRSLHPPANEASLLELISLKLYLFLAAFHFRFEKKKNNVSLRACTVMGKECFFFEMVKSSTGYHGDTRELKQRRFWATDFKRKSRLLLFDAYYTLFTQKVKL